MNCPLCNEPVYGPPDELEDVWHNHSCECGGYSVDYWDKEIQHETVDVSIDLENFRVIFDRAKNETRLLQVYYHERDDANWTEYILTVPPIKKIPNEQELRKKIKVWLTFQ